MKKIFLSFAILIVLITFVSPSIATNSHPIKSLQIEQAETKILNGGTIKTETNLIDKNIRQIEIKTPPVKDVVNLNEVKPVDGKTKKIKIKSTTDITNPEDPSLIYVISKDPEKCKPAPCKTFTVRKEGVVTIIEDGAAETKTSLPIKVEEDKITIEVKGQSETVILPSEAKRVVETRPEIQGPLPIKISKIELTSCEPKPGPEPPCLENGSIYKIEVEKENNFLGVVSVKSKFNYEISAVNGKVMTESKPWYLRVVPFLFKS